MSNYGNTPTVVRRTASPSGPVVYAQQLSSTSRLRDSKILSSPLGEEEEKHFDSSNEFLDRSNDNLSLSVKQPSSPGSKTPVVEKNSSFIIQEEIEVPEQSMTNEENLCSVGEAVRENRKSFMHYESHHKKSPTNKSLVNGNSKSTIRERFFNNMNEDCEDPDVIYKESLSYLKKEHPNETKSSTPQENYVDDDVSPINQTVLLEYHAQLTKNSNGLEFKKVHNVTNDSCLSKSSITDDSSAELSKPLINNNKKIDKESLDIISEKNNSSFSTSNSTDVLIKTNQADSSVQNSTKNLSNFSDKEKVSQDKLLENTNISSPLDQKKLKNLPLRGPTPPKSSPRKSSKSQKAHKDKSSIILQDTKSNEENSLSSTSSKQNESFNEQNKTGIQNLIVDSSVKENFIVVHPTEESNSIGLAPLSPSLQHNLVITSSEDSSTVMKSENSPGIINIKGFSSKKQTSLSNLSSATVTKRTSPIVQAPSSPNISEPPRRYSNTSQTSLKMETKKSYSSIPELSTPSKSSLLPPPSGQDLSQVDCDSVVPLDKNFGSCIAKPPTSKLCSVM